jgi:lipopolysaccharide export system permease protein
MRILRRYYMKEFLKLFAVTGLGLSLTFSLMELINRINDFIPGKPAVADLALYALLNLPQYLLYLMPMAALISGLFVFGQAGHRKETTAVKSSGGSIKALLLPFVFSGVILSLAGFLIGEFIVPDFSMRTRSLRDALSKRENVLVFREGTVWLRAKDAIVKIDLFLPDRGVIRGVSIMKLEGHMLTERIEAESAEWKPAWEASGSRKGGVWYLKGVTDYRIKTGTIENHAELQSDLIDSPDLFREDMQKPEEMNVRELMAYTKRLRDAGFRNTKLIVDIHSRISYPLINAVMLVLGIALAIRGIMGSGMITAAVGIFISLLYWVGYTASLSLGYTGILPAFVAAWLMPVLFGGIAFYLFSKIPE